MRHLEPEDYDTRPDVDPDFPDAETDPVQAMLKRQADAEWIDTSFAEPYVAVDTRRKGWLCQECGRVFDPLNKTDAQEFYYGHDCESN